MSFEVDLAKNSERDIVGTFSVPAQHLNGLPLVKVVVSDGTMTFGAREDQLFSLVVVIVVVATVVMRK